MNEDQPESLSRARRKHHTTMILREVLADDRLSDPRWSSLSLRFLLTNHGRNFGNTGYAYDEERNWWALAFPTSRLYPMVLAYVEESFGGSPDNVCSVLLQYQKSTGRALLTIEKEIPPYWPVTKRAAGEAAMALKPDFSPQS